MEVMYVLLPAALVFAIAAVVVFVWAVRSGQLDDLETPAMRILGDDEAPPPIRTDEVRSESPPPGYVSRQRAWSRKWKRTSEKTPGS